MSGTPLSLFPQVPLKKPFLPRRIIHRLPQETPLLQPEELKEWATSIGLEEALGPLILTTDDRLKVLWLLYQYRHLNKMDLRDLPCTNLITHRVKIAPGTKLASSKH